MCLQRKLQARYSKDIAKELEDEKQKWQEKQEAVDFRDKAFVRALSSLYFVASLIESAWAVPSAVDS